MSSSAASAAPGTPATKNAARHPQCALIAPPRTKPNAEPIGIAA